ncbi:hypothetical protein [Mycobacterium sp. GA-2829]|uniref:hypothetical protein n=1 Tax=Mycobacterium sp. GA-2829 TaxID=1772283 RepID=UPI00074052DA|nr:hypothetical protein [Mycobacterium sp. GA-2829]KUI34200.1 hypothetical protein AU194_17775 [Mycobacterium sp. GA-2829]
MIGLDSDAVLTAARRIGCHADDVRATHSSSQEGLDAGLHGCVGRSGQALAALSQRWEPIARRQGEGLDALSRAVGAAGATLLDADHTNAARVARIND